MLDLILDYQEYMLIQNNYNKKGPFVALVIDPKMTLHQEKLKLVYLELIHQKMKKLMMLICVILNMMQIIQI